MAVSQVSRNSGFSPSREMAKAQGRGPGWSGVGVQTSCPTHLPWPYLALHVVSTPGMGRGTSPPSCNGSKWPLLQLLRPLRPNTACGYQSWVFVHRGGRLVSSKGDPSPHVSGPLNIAPFRGSPGTPIQIRKLLPKDNKLINPQPKAGWR